MDSKPAIDFATTSKGFQRINSLNSLLTESLDVEVKSVDFRKRKTSDNKKTKTNTKFTEKQSEENLDIAYRFPLSIALINLLRNPQIDQHQFFLDYLTEIQKEVYAMECSQECQPFALYMHLILAQIQNIEEMEELGLKVPEMEVVPFNRKIWNKTNLMNVKCMLIHLSRLPPLSAKPAKLYTKIEVEVVHNLNTYFIEQGVIIISKNYIELALESNGHLDVYFGPFFANQFSFVANLWFTNFNDNSLALENYSNIFKQIAKEALQYSTLDYKQWYEEQVKKIINGQFHHQDLAAFLNHTKYNPWVQKLLIALQGWKGLTDAAVRLLNVYYDNCDWQIYSEYTSVIHVTGDPFQINYLIDNPEKHQQSIVYCLHAPCLDESIPLEIFSWHIPELVEYNYDGLSYLSAEMDFGVFPRSGFYNFAMFNLFDHGKEVVNKILNIERKGSSSKVTSTTYSNPLMTIKSVKGRMIVQPPQTRELCLHEVSVDTLAPEQGLFRTSDFEDATKELDRYNQSGVNAIYIAGVFERDNEATAEVYRKPNASPLAFTHRTYACKMLGGDAGLKALIDRAHYLNIKVIVDCSVRVSSSHMAKQYEGLRLKAVDEQGRIVFHYGANGRSISYDDTTPLNYRKKQSWDLLLSQVVEIVKKFRIDGIYLDNGFDWPPIYKINEDQLFRKQTPTDEPVYTNDQIFEGEVIVPTKIAGFWASPLHATYPNPFILNICKTLWRQFPKLIIIAEALEIPENDSRFTSVIRSGPIPRSYRMPKALAQIMGVNLSTTGEVTQMQVKHASNLKKWYEQSMKMLPKGTLIVHSTTSPVWPYLPYVFKKATWAVIDVLHLMPLLLMTSGSQLLGHSYKSRSININYLPAQTDKPQQVVGKGFSRAASSFMTSEYPKTKRGNIVHCTNTLLKDPSQLKYLESTIKKEVRPEFGFDLDQIYKHYAHRRQLRKQYRSIRSGQIMLITAEHIYGAHNNVLSFARYNEEQILLISINFNPDDVDMHYNLSPLKALFKKYQHSNIILKLESILNPTKFVDEYYMVSQLLASKIDAHIQPYNSIIWKLTVQDPSMLPKAIECSSKRIQERLSRQPPAWIYSSVYFNELSHLLTAAKTKKGVVKGLNELYNKCIQPYNLNFSLLISKNHEFYVNKGKLQKLFGIFELIHEHPDLSKPLQKGIQEMVSGNTLGPIAFVTPEIGSWSSVGGLGVMVDELSKELARLGEQVYIITPYYHYNKKKQTDYLERDGFTYHSTITVKAAHFSHEFGIHRGKYCGVNYIWYHNSDLFSKPYDGQGAFFVSKQLVFFALTTLQAFCQLKIFPSTVVTNDWMCGFVSAYVKQGRFKQVFGGTKFMHICHNLDPLYEGRLYPKVEEGNLGWLINLPPEWYMEYTNNKVIINPSRCALESCDNWGTVSNSYKIQLLKESDLAAVLWKYPHPFSFPNGIRKQQRLGILRTKTPGNHPDSKFLLQKKYFQCSEVRKEVPLFAFIGRVTRQKGVHLILEAAQSLMFETNFQIQFLLGGMADSKEEYGRYCADKMRFLHHKYPQCFWSNPDQFFSDGPLVNIGSDFSMMPSMFEPGGIVQHEFFCAGTPVITFCTGGLKDTVFEFDTKTLKGNGFNFLSYDLEDFKRCMRRAIECYKNTQAYEKLRENAAESVVEEEDVARGWNNEFYRMQNKIYIDKTRVEMEIKRFQENDDKIQGEEEIKLFDYRQGEFYKKSWEVMRVYRQVLQSASRLDGKSHTFCYETKKFPRPKEVYVTGSWDNWKEKTKLNFLKISKNYKISIKLKPDTYHYKYYVDGEWLLNEFEESEEDQYGHINHKVVIE